MALNMAKKCTKVGLVGGTVYWSAQQGVWGTSEEGYVAMKKLSDAIAPTQEPVRKAVETIDGSAVLSAWNKGSKVVFQSLIEAPETVEVYACQASNVLSKYVDDKILPK